MPGKECKIPRRASCAHHVPVNQPNQMTILKYAVVRREVVVAHDLIAQKGLRAQSGFHMLWSEVGNLCVIVGEHGHRLAKQIF